MSWDKLDRSEVINIIDRDRDVKTIECKYSTATIYKHQQIVIICNEIPSIFLEDKAVQSRVTIIHVDFDLRLYIFNENINNVRTTTRGNHLRHPPPQVFLYIYIYNV